MTLGQLLRSTRLAQSKTLRDVEAVAGISNGYLSQLESDAIKQPSPHHLHKLADVYHLDYALLMESAGYAVAREIGIGSSSQLRSSLPEFDELTDEDKRKIKAYITDLRDARRARRSETEDSP